jgi:hypothetical protein
MAPFTLYFTEYMYQFLKLYVKTATAAEEMDPQSSSPSLVLEDEEGTAKSFHS